jgi:hypothetical protein
MICLPVSKYDLSFPPFQMRIIELPTSWQCSKCQMMKNLKSSCRNASSIVKGQYILDMSLCLTDTGGVVRSGISLILCKYCLCIGYPEFQGRS